jgi:hypothetical protein
MIGNTRAGHKTTQITYQYQQKLRWLINRGGNLKGLERQVKRSVHPGEHNKKVNLIAV